MIYIKYIKNAGKPSIGYACVVILTTMHAQKILINDDGFQVACTVWYVPHLGLSSFA